MKRLLILLLLFFCANCFAQRLNGRIADVVSLNSYTDEYFNTSYSVGIKNKSDKIITSIRVRYMFEGTNPQTHLWGVDDYDFTHQLRLSPGEAKTTQYFQVTLKHSHYTIKGAYILADRFSDGSMIQRTSDNGLQSGSGFTFGDYVM